MTLCIIIIIIIIVKISIKYYYSLKIGTFNYLSTYMQHATFFVDIHSIIISSIIMSATVTIFQNLVSCHEQLILIYTHNAMMIK